MQQISSAHNEKIKRLRSLQQKKFRREDGCYLIEGRRLVSEAVLRGAEILSVVVAQERAENFEELLAQTRQAEQLCVPEAVFRTLCLTEAPEGIAACVKMRCEPAAEEDSPFVLLLDGLQDPGNLGTILRTANACGIREVYLSGNCVEVYNPKVVRSAMGALFSLRFREDCNLPQTVERLRNAGRTVIGTALSGEDYYRASFSGKLALVIGNEGNGVSDEVLARCSRTVKLPVSPDAESLNAAVAAGILMYDLKYRQG